MTTIQAESLVPAAMLQQLAPAASGSWVVLQQAADRVTLAFVTNDGQNSYTYDIYTCSTEDEVVNVCGDAVYNYNPNFSGMYQPTAAPPGQPQPMQMVIRPRIVNLQRPGYDVQSSAGVNGQGQVEMTQQQIAAILGPGQPQNVHANALGNAQAFGLNGTAAPNTANNVYLPSNFLGIDNIAEDQTAWGPITADLSMLGPNPGHFAATGDYTFMATELEPQLDWTLFTNN